MRKLISYSFALLNAIIISSWGQFLFAQTGPAGVGSSVENQVWLDAHSLGFPDGSPIGAWTDVSGNENTFLQGVSVRQPLYNTTGIAGISSLTFDGVNDVIASGAIPALESANITYFMVYDRTTTTSDMLINCKYTSNFKKWRTYMNNGQSTIINAHFSPSINWVRYTDPPGASFLSTHITPTSFTSYNQGDMEMTKTATYTTPSGHNNVFIGNRNSMVEDSYTYTGEIAEVILYNTALNPLQRVLVENYLGAKYLMTIPTDHYAYETTHRFGLIGIGDDGTDTQTSARGAGILEISDAADLGSDEYFLVAHTDFPTNEYNEEDLPAEFPDHQRFERTWRVGETGDAGTTTLTFFLGDDDFAVSETYRLLVDDDGTFSDATAHTGTHDEVAQTLTFEINLEDGDYFTIAGVEQILIIHSVTDGLWSETSTWDCTCIPGTNDVVFIDPGHEVTVDVDGFTGDFAIELTATLIMDSDVTLNINGDWDIRGLTDFSDGTISLTGDIGQDVTIISSSTVVIGLNDLHIENTSDDSVKFINRTFELNGTLSPARGNIVFDPSTRFVIKSSSATEGGRVGQVIAPTTLTGNVHVERFIPAGAAGWRDLCSPVNGSTFDDWDPDLAMSGPGFPDGCAFGPEGCFNSVTYTDHSIQYNVLNSTDPILNGRGFEIFVGTNLETFDGTTITSTGTLNSSTDIVYSYSTGWTIFGNPYASPIAYGTLALSGSIGNYFYVYDPASGAYEWYDGASGTSSLPEITENGLMATGQAVWIFASSAGTITLNQFNKAESNATYIRAPESGNSLRIVLSENNSTFSCTARLEELTGALDGTDEDYDIRHLSTGLEKAPSLAFRSGDDILRKNFIKNDGRDKSFGLHSKILNDGLYTISAENWGNFRAYHKILLHDSVTGETVNLKENDYVFFAKADSDETDNDGRFTLILTSENVAETTTTDFVQPGNNLEGQLYIKQMGHMIDVLSKEDLDAPTTVSVTNVTGQEEVFVISQAIVSGSNMIHLPAHLKGFHIITLRTGNNIITHKVIL